MGHYNQIIRNQNACSVASARGILKTRCDHFSNQDLLNRSFVDSTHTEAVIRKPLSIRVIESAYIFLGLQRSFFFRKLVIVGFRTSYNDTPHFRADPVLLILSIVDRKNAKLSLFMHQGM